MIQQVGARIVRPVAGFARGFSYPMRALRFFSQKPGLIRYMLIPFFINMVVFSLTVYLGLDLFDKLLEAYAPSSEIWYGALLYYLAWTVALLLTSVIVFFSFTVVGNLIASPFNELLSERAEALRSGLLPEVPFTIGTFLAESRFAFMVELKKMTIFIVCMALLFLINFLPGIGSLIYAVLAPLLTLFFLVIEYMAFVLMRKHMSFAEQRRYILRHPMMMLGFACSLFCLLAVPFVQFFCIPLAVVGATLIWCDFPASEENGGG